MNLIGPSLLGIVSRTNPLDTGFLYLPGRTPPLAAWLSYFDAFGPIPLVFAYYFPDVSNRKTL